MNLEYPYTGQPNEWASLFNHINSTSLSNVLHLIKLKVVYDKMDKVVFSVFVFLTLYVPPSKGGISCMCK